MNTSFLKRLGLGATNPGTWSGQKSFSSKRVIVSYSPVDGKEIGKVSVTGEGDYEKIMKAATTAFDEWKTWPAPRRGEIVRQYGDVLRAHKDDLGRLVSYEMGKSLQEGLGEVQEMIDICDFAVGLSRQLYGLSMHSERPSHRMYEQWHPLGVVGVISAFNFPVAVWSWNAMIAMVCGDVVVWKGSEKTPLCAVACQSLLAKVLKANDVPEGVSCIVTGDYTLGQKMSNDHRIPLISATGSTRMGKAVASSVAARLGKSLLELGGNNAVIVTPSADLSLVLPATVFGAVGTAGQRCTTTRRLIVHADIYDKVKAQLVKAYKQISIGNPLDARNHVGPLIDAQAVENYLAALEKAKKEGGKLLVKGGEVKVRGCANGHYVQPAIVEARNDMSIVQTETFAPILYLIKYEGEVTDAIAIQNDVPQGLSSAIMTSNLREAELFLAASGSDCGIANVNIGTSGAEIGGAFGGEKETGGGRESGSDSWKAYMRRQTNTINYSTKLPLAQGIKFDF
ncbi:MAG: aldehyde dehydrogenase family protein [Saprospiraceae bacterium]|nr:aldehyde dehydrogenase family protein [Saprospiraceae bacterium]MBK8849403.1 aldehyde dehydrogenase family protein [Saprospiraceae bacterium]MBL0083724.1 aldehyde dehydrogenase family protein [Saprospiraceae bacterium]HMS99506.1 aldehyde dehydrogenase family protein [Saprospiraceae bacterium]HRG20375.1 aldehyde dehydrogenase family protein [Saprospiraceae bacterium]